MNRRLPPVLLAALLLLGSAALAADTGTRAARQHYSQGTGFYKEARYPEAIDAFRAAYAAKQNGVVFFNIAQCYEKLGELPSALEAYRRYLKEVPAAEDRATVETVIGNLEQRLAAQRDRSQTVHIGSEPAGAAVTVAKTGRGQTPLEISLSPGTYEVRVEREGYVPVDRSITVSNAPVQLDLTLSAVAALAPVTAPATAKEPRKRVWTWVAVGLGGASLLGAATAGALARQSADSYQTSAGSTDRATVNRYQQDARARAKASNVLWGVGGGLLAVGVTLFLVETKF